MEKYKNHPEVLRTKTELKKKKKNSRRAGFEVLSYHDTKVNSTKFP